VLDSRGATGSGRAAAVGGDALAGEVRAQVRRGELPAQVEGAKVGELRGGGVEAHLVEEVLDVGDVVGPEGDAPLPVVHADRPRDHLLDLAGVVPADVAVALHVFCSLLEGQVVPVLVRVASLRHRIEGDVLVVGDPGVEPRADVLGELRVVVDLAVDVLAGALRVARRLRHGDVRGGLLGESGEFRPLEPPFEVFDVRVGGAEVDDHEVGLVAGDCKQRRVAPLGVLDGGRRLEERGGLLDRPAAHPFGSVPPGGPVYRPQIV
jgi:hypothetical protein